MPDIGGSGVVRRHAGSLGPSVQRAEVLTDGFLGLAVLSQNRRGLAPEGGPAHLLSPGFVSVAAVEDGPAQFRVRLTRDKWPVTSPDRLRYQVPPLALLYNATPVDGRIT